MMSAMANQAKAEVLEKTTKTRREVNAEGAELSGCGANAHGGGGDEEKVVSARLMLLFCCVPHQILR